MVYPHFAGFMTFLATLLLILLAQLCPTKAFPLTDAQSKLTSTSDGFRMDRNVFRMGFGKRFKGQSWEERTNANNREDEALMAELIRKRLDRNLYNVGFGR